MLLEIILLKELLNGLPLSGTSGKFTKETAVVLPVEPKPVIQGKTVGESLVALTYPAGWDAQKVVVNLDPEQVAIYEQSIETKKALRKI